MLLGSFFDQRLVDKVHAVIAPMIIGGATAPVAVAGEGAERMSDALRLRETSVERLGERHARDRLSGVLMFTGIIEELGRVREADEGRLVIEAKVALEGTRLGDSIAVNGCDLTVAEMSDGRIHGSRHAGELSPHEPERPASQATPSTSSGR